jgi:molybdate transport system ATP-binding protein
MARFEARLVVDFGEFRLAVELDLPLEGIAVVFGPSGSGKTTLLRALAGISRRATGFVRFDGELWQDDARGVRLPTHRRGVGCVFQDGRLFPHLSVRSNLLYGERRTPAAARKLELERVLDLLDLAPLLSRRTQALSGGERQRVAIGRALLASPRLLLMDEPLASVDLARRGEILPFVEALPRALGIPIVYVTHSLDEMLRLASRVVLVERGRVVAEGPLEQVSERIDEFIGTSELDPGTVVSGEVIAFDESFALATIRFGGGELRIPTPAARLGETRRIRIRSRDVALSLDPPGRATILNVLRGTIREIEPTGPGDADVIVDVGVPLRARITRRSAVDLGLAPGVAVHALVKAVALESAAEAQNPASNETT